LTLSSRSLLSMPVPCQPRAAARLLERLEERLRLEASAGLLMAILCGLGSAWSLHLPEPLGARIIYSVSFAAFSLLALAYSARRRREASAAAALRSRLVKGDTPAKLCDLTLGDLLAAALRPLQRSGVRTVA